MKIRRKHVIPDYYEPSTETIELMFCFCIYFAYYAFSFYTDSLDHYTFVTNAFGIMRDNNTDYTHFCVIVTAVFGIISVIELCFDFQVVWESNNRGRDDTPVLLYDVYVDTG